MDDSGKLSKFEEDFCGNSTFWDFDLIWNNPQPDFPGCFQDTILSWVPLFIIIFFSFFEVPGYFSKHNKNRNIRLNWYNVLKILFTLALIAINIGQLVLFALEDGDELTRSISPADYLFAACYLLSHIISFCVLLLSLKYGFRASYVQFIFYLVSSICEAIVVRSAILRDEGGEMEVIKIEEDLMICQLVFGGLMLILNFFADTQPTKYDETLKGLKNECSELSASVPSKLTFGWVATIIWKGLRNDLDTEMLWDLHPNVSSRGIVPIWDSFYAPAVEAAKKTDKLNKEAANKDSKDIERTKHSIFPALLKTFGYEFFLGSFFQALYSIMIVCGPPQIQDKIIEYVGEITYGNLEEYRWRAYYFAGLLFATNIFISICNGQYFNKMYVIAMKVRTALNSAIYRKAVKLSSTARKESTVGEIVNLMSVDVQRFMDLLPYINMVWSSPLQIALSVYWLHKQLGNAIFAGLAVIILAIPLNFVITIKMRGYQMDQMKNKDKRIKLMNELLGGIKVIKLYGWEKSFIDQVQGIRKKEEKVLRKSAWMSALMSFIWTTIPFLTIAVAFITFIFMDDANQLTSDIAFVSLTLMNGLQFQMTVLPMLIVFLVQAGVSLQRVNKFMNNDELDEDAVTHDPDVKERIKVENGSFKWGEKEPVVLNDINFSVERGSLTAIVGTVGSGKSTLLGACLGDIVKVSGSVNVNGTTAYVPQQAWMQNATLKDNILFGEPYDKNWYEEVIEACALRTDLEMLPGGDQTEIGEKGINLSGGQKQRVSLARAVYSKSDLLFLDDPLSAVDSHVGKHIFNKVISHEGVLGDKTVVLVTHGVSFLPKTDKIIVMKNGKISEQGSYTELLERKGEFADFLIEYMAEQEGEEGEDHEEIKAELERAVGREKFQRQLSTASIKRKESLSPTALSPTTPKKEPETRIRQESVTVHSDGGVKATDEVEEAKKPKDVEEKAGAKLIEKESIKSGNVSIQVYFHYFKNMGLFVTLIIFLLMAVYEGTNIGKNYWLTVWTGNELGNATEPHWRNIYIGVYIGLGIAQSVSMVIISVIMAISTLKGSSRMHNIMLERVMRSPMSFFDTTPLGRIVNRFAKDVDVCDNTLPQSIKQLIVLVFDLFGIILLVIVLIPIVAAVILPFSVIFYLIQKFYVTTSRQLKRLESNTRSPIYSHFGETLTGSSTIRAFNMEDSFIVDSETKIDLNQKCYFPSIMANRWLALATDMIGNVIIFAIVVFAITSDNVDKEDVGIVITYALTITQNLNYLVRYTSEVETNIVAVERLKEYSDLKQEAPWKTKESDNMDKKWPHKGEVQFNQYAMRYRDGLELVIKGITCNIKGGEKIGIVGRTGAGKSSLTMAMFRLCEPAQGGMMIDGKDTVQLGLHDLRPKITIIPQEPVLFSGSLRMNLDPFNIYSDEQIWSALKLSHLHDFVSALDDGINHEIAEGGDNLSIGQRQLVCLARALLKKTRILVLDEATAAVDLETDDLIQGTIRAEFEDSTVLTIAHRLNTIMDYDRIMVLDKGRIAEFDSVQELLKMQDGIFHSMVKAAGLLTTIHEEEEEDEEDGGITKL